MANYAADIETSGLLAQMLLQEKPVLHNMGFKDLDTNQEILFSNRFEELDLSKKQYKGIEVYPLSKLQPFLQRNPTLHMHNGMLFDGEALLLLNYSNIEHCRIEDSLYLSWYLEPRRMRHGLAEYGEDYGIPKPAIEDWENQTQDEYNHRVMQDVRIQARLTKDQHKQLKSMYLKGYKHVTDYFDMKARHMRTQQRNRWKLDVEATVELRKVLEVQLDLQVQELAKVMPKVDKLVLKTPPAKAFTVGGKLSAHGKKWYTLLLQNHEPANCAGVVVVARQDEPNPNSPIQVKDWLDSYGWVPQTFKYTRDKDTGEEKKTAQVNIPNSGGAVDPGIEALMRKHPDAGFQHIKGLGILKHRLGMVKGFLENNVDGYLTARAQGFTNTLRLKHRELVNLPSSRVPYGKEIRGLLIAEDGYVLLGSDLSSLEDKCKHHYQWPHDPEYVKLQQVPGFDPHLTIAGIAGLLTEAQIQAHKDKEEDHSATRSKGKSTNYACQYGAGPATVARTAGVPFHIGEKLWQAYQDLNWSIKVIAESTTVQKMAGNSWQLNPVNGIWYWLKTEKDRFSTLCQGTGSYICDLWIEQVHEICRERVGKDAPIVGEFHDELIMRLRDSEKAKEVMKEITLEAINRVNELLKMNTTLACEVQFGKRYSEIH